MALPEISILGIKVNPITEDELNGEIARIIRAGRKELVLNVNVNAINQALKHPFMKELLNRAAIVFCDGYGVILGARILGADIPERITYADWMWSLSALCEREGFSFYLPGSAGRDRTTGCREAPGEISVFEGRGDTKRVFREDRA